MINNPLIIPLLVLAARGIFGGRAGYHDHIANYWYFIEVSNIARYTVAEGLAGESSAVFPLKNQPAHGSGEGGHT